MLHNPALEASYVSTYVEDYLDGLENLPNLIQPHISEIKRLDVEYTAVISNLRRLQQSYCSCSSEDARSRVYNDICQHLYRGQLIGDDKLTQLSAIHDLIEAKTDQLEHDANSFGCSSENQSSTGSASQRPSRTTTATNSSIPLPKASAKHRVSSPPVTPVPPSERRVPSSAHKREHPSSGSAASKRARRQKEFPDFVRESAAQINEKVAKSPAHSTSAGSTTGDHEEAIPSTKTPKQQQTAVGRKAKHKSASMSARKKRAVQTPTASTSTSTRKRTNSQTAAESEPIYCVCSQASYGDMVGCDYDNCDIEWFHFSCVGLTGKPKGKWYCPECRGDKANVLKHTLK